MRNVLCSGLAISGAFLAFGIVPNEAAFACSDLPNICAQQAQHHQQMIDIAATSPQGVEDPRYEAPPVDPMQTRMSVATGMIQMMQRSVDDAAKLAALKKDPRYGRYENGGWDFFQDHANPRPGEYCAAFYWKKTGLVRLSGPGGDYPGALLTFWGEDIPRPDSVKKIKVTLSQSDGGAPQTVEALNYYLPGDGYGAIALTVPSIDALLDNMLDIHGFDLAIKGASVAKVDWDGGFSARDKLKKCVSARRPG